ncbi:MAG: NAD-dependent protein deacetylase [Gammaproteobacteria bacterium]|jgi:NAD-dependent SIR2 family protein deacetylase|nr:NAD-dependent protein deacetylase [Gammaproteobacteria bacterium]MBT3868600.1 NAD-dependent protein deacetylase [Gammaproteobacteria bacterium]MBT4380358.1 NAD-dependent protein deacetylase [Gammaproteobacteria bacterium]MBT4617903.1 NAD-dependent protein deacetylase [Gammaproteobacteria bacterium]MBT5197011.1 NAD-dependent protein deacetylase [Gammaproteobacteria bacterium]
MAESSKCPDSDDLQHLQDFLADKRNLVVLSGAGISVGSGIPTYRDKAGNWKRSNPIQHQDFMSRKSARQRYWLRSYSGWPAVASAVPSPSHRAIAELERRKIVKMVVTQNVDRLHQHAGSRNVIDLHGRLDEVICMCCQKVIPRHDLQSKLTLLNPSFSQQGEIAPDGDAEVAEGSVPFVAVPPCENCGGILKPNVVFFGDNVNKSIVQRVYDGIDDSDGMLIVGTSLKVFSGYRFCRYAAQQRKPIASINPGLSRGDKLIQTIVRSDSDDVLTPVLKNIISSVR